MPPLSAWLAAAAMAAPLALLQAAPASAADMTAAPDAPAGHHGVAFAAPKDARPRIVEPDGRVLDTDGASDLVAPASIATRRAETAIGRLIQAEATSRHSGSQASARRAVRATDAPALSRGI